MAAETLTATRAIEPQPYTPTGGGALCCAYGTYEVAANVEDGDIFEMCRIPAGSTIVGGMFYADDLDTGTEALSLDVGWAANGVEAKDADGLLVGGTMTGDAFAAGNISPTAGLIYPFTGNSFVNGDLPTFTNETTIQVEANTAAGTFTAGAMSIVVYYVVG